MSMEPSERKCPFCGSAIEGVASGSSGEYECPHCRAVGRYEGENLIAMSIPGYRVRIREMEQLEKEVTEEIGLEALRGPGRDMGFLQRKNVELQRIQSEQAFLAHFRVFVEKW